MSAWTKDHEAALQRATGAAPIKGRETTRRERDAERKASGKAAQLLRSLLVDPVDSAPAPRSKSAAQAAAIARVVQRAIEASGRRVIVRPIFGSSPGIEIRFSEEP